MRASRDGVRGLHGQYGCKETVRQCGAHEDARAASLSGYGGTPAVRYSEEIKAQLLEHEGREYPDWLVACVGGGSNASGTVYHYLDDSRVKIVLAEAGGKGVDSGMTAATIYMVSSASVTGGRKDFAGDRLEYFRRIAGMGLRNPRMIGFGISSQRTWQAAAENASGGIVGSLFVQLLEEASGDADKAVRRLKTLLYGPSAFPDGYML